MKFKDEITNIIHILMLGMLFLNLVINLLLKNPDAHTQKLIDDLTAVRNILEEIKKT